MVFKSLYTDESILEQEFIYRDEGKTIDEYIDDISEQYSYAFDNYADIAFYLFYYGSQVTVPRQKLIEIGDNLVRAFDFLVLGLSYTVYTFVDNLSGNEIVSDEQQVNTLKISPHAKVFFEFINDNIDADELVQAIARKTKWNLKL